LAAGTVLRSTGRFWDPVAFGAAGAIVGIAQWAVLRRFGVSPAWIACVWLSWAVLDVSVRFYSSPYWPAAIGAALGAVVQSRIVWRRMPPGALWVAAATAGSVLGWMAGLRVGTSVYSGSATEFWAYAAGGATGGAIASLISAPVLVAMVRHSKSLVK